MNFARLLSYSRFSDVNRPSTAEVTKTQGFPLVINGVQSLKLVQASNIKA
jgi:hypothetical protein